MAGKYKCLLCEKEFISESGVKYHINSVHAEVRRDRSPAGRGGGGVGRTCRVLALVCLLLAHCWNSPGLKWSWIRLNAAGEQALCRIASCPRLLLLRSALAFPVPLPRQLPNQI